MANVNANVNVIVNTQQAVTQLRLLTAEINNFNKQSFAANSAAAQQQKALNQALIDGVRTSGKFSTSIIPITSSVDKFSESLERNRLSLGQYTRYAASQLPGMRKILTREFDMINSLAEQRVKKLNTQFVRIGQSANGMQQALAMTPNALDQFSSRSAIALQRQQIFNKLLRDGSTQLLNYGKNTQWAGRQLMVGFTIPLALLGAQAAKVFKEIEAEAINFKKVYGDMFTTDKEVEQNLSAIKELAKEMTKYGQSAQQTMQLANTAAQSGARGEGLMAATTQATRLAILGQMEQAQAIETTISLQTAFSLSNEKLAESINFLNSVENQTILSLQDVSEAIPRVASVINGFGGNVQDLSVLLVAMKEGGVSAAEGANALKNSMARIISPTKNALEITAKYGISLQEIVSRNEGQVVPLFMELSKALEAIGGQPRQEVLSAVFGKFQYARMGTLLSNIAKEGSQAAKAIELTKTETADLAATAERELGTVEDSISTKFTAALEKAKIALAPIGGEFLKALTPVLEVIAKILGKFDELPGGIKTAIVAATAIIGGIAPVLLMVVGLVANGIANIAKFIMFLRKQIGTLRGNAEQFKHYSMAELEAAAATASLEGKTSSLTKTMLLQKPAIESLITLYARLAASAKLAAASMPATMGMPGAPVGRGGGFAAVAPRLPIVRRNSGGEIFESSGGKTMVPGSGNTDTVPAMLTPGEFVINKKATQENFSLIKAINDGEINTNSQSKAIPAIKPQVQQAFGGAWIAKFINSSWKSSVGRNSAPAQLRDAIPQSIRNEVENNLKAVLSRADIDFKKIPKSVWKDMSKVDLAHIKPEIDKNGQKVWRLKNLMTVPGLENNGLDILFGKRRVKSKKMFLDVAKKDPEFSKKYAYQIDKIIKNSGHPRTRKDYEFLQELFKKTSSDPQGSAWLKSNSKAAKTWFPALNAVVNDRLDATKSIFGLPLPIPKDPKLKYNVGGLVAAANAARGARGRIPGNIVDWFSRMTTSINQSSRDDLLQNIPANIKRGLSTSRRNFDITRGSIDPISGGSLKEVSSWSTGQGVGRFMESSRLFETLDNSKFQIAQRSQGMKRAIDMLKDLGPDGPGPGKPYSPFNREDGGILNTNLTPEEIKEAGGVIWKANKKKVEARIQRDQEFIAGHQKIIDDLQESYIPTIYKTSVKKGEKYFDVSERIVPKDDQRISNPAASTDILQEKEIALLKAKLIGEPTTRIVEKSEAQARYDKAKEEIKKLRMQIVKKEISREEAQPILNRLYDESENMASFVNWGRGREVFYPDVVSMNKGGMIPGVQHLMAGAKVMPYVRPKKPAGPRTTELEKEVMKKRAAASVAQDKALDDLIFRRDKDGKLDLTPSELLVLLRENPNISDKQLKEISKYHGSRIRKGIFGHFDKERGYKVRDRSFGTWGNISKVLDERGYPVIQKRNTGGFISPTLRMNNGNIVPGVGNTDTVPAMLTPGEFVINKQSTQENLPLLHAINDGKTSGFNKGGIIPGYNIGGMVSLSRFIKKILSMPKSKQEIYFRAGMQTDDPKNMSHSPQSLNIVAYQKRRLLKDKAVGELSALKIPGRMNHTREDMQPLGQLLMFSPSPIGRPWTIGSLAVRPGYETLVSQLLGLAARQTISRSGVLPAASTNLSQHSSRTVEFLAKRGIVKDLRSSKADFNEVTKKDSKGMIRDAEDAIKSSSEIWKISPKELEQSSNMVRGLLRSTRQKKINNTEQLSLFSNGGMIPGVQHLMGGGRAVALQRMRTMKASSQTQQRATSTTPKSKTLMGMTDDDYNANFGSILKQSEIEDQASKTAFPSFNIKKNDQDYIFKGYGQEVPPSVIGKNKVLGITPQELLREALIHRPGDKKLIEMLNNFNNKKYGKNENRLLDDIAASISIDRKGKMGVQEDAAGYAQVLSSLMGDSQATRLVSLKRKSLYSELDKIKRIKQKEARANPQDTDATWDDKVFIHSTARGVNIDKKGNALIYSAGDATRGTPDSVPRSTVHTTINAPVESHMAGAWGDSNQLIVGNAKKVLSSNNPPSMLNVTDTAFPLNPGQPLRIPNASVVTPMSDAEKYKRLLMERKLVSNDRKNLPFIVNDDQTNDVLYFIKKDGTYTDDDRAAILKDTGYIARPKDIIGRETDILKDEALTRAMRQQKVEGRPQKLAQWGTNNPDFDKGVNRLAAQKGISGGIHQGSPSERLEMSAINNQSYTSESTFGRFNDADIYSIRHVVASGHSKTKQRPLSTSRLDDDFDLTLNKGGFISPTLRMNDGNIVPGMGSQDTVPAMLTPGEFVINKKSSQENLQLLHAINDGSLPGYELGGLIDGESQTSQRKGSPYKGGIAKEIEAIRKSGQVDLANRLERQYIQSRAAMAAAGLSGQIDRAHTVEVDKKIKPPPGVSARAFTLDPNSPWHGSKIAMQPTFENNLSNAFATTKAGVIPAAQTEILSRLNKSINSQIEQIRNSSESEERRNKRINVLEKRREAMTTKLTKNLALNNAELQLQSRLLAQGPISGLSDQLRTNVISLAQARKTLPAISALAPTFGPGVDEKNAKSSLENRNRAIIAKSGMSVEDSRTQRRLQESEHKQAIKQWNAGGKTGPKPEKPSVKMPTPRASAQEILERRQKLADSKERRISARENELIRKRPSLSPEAARAIAERQIARSGGGSGGGKGGGGTVSPVPGAPDDNSSQSKKTGRFSAMSTKVGQLGMGAGMALSMASMMPMMGADKETGKWMGMDSMTAMMGMMGGGMLLSIAPMLQSAALPVMAVAAAAGGLAIGLKIWRNSVDNAAKKSAELGAELGGASNAAGNMAKLLGLENLQSQRNRMRLSIAPDQEEGISKYASSFESESGKEFLKSLQSLTAAEKFKKVSDYLRTAIASGMMDKDNAQSFAKAIGVVLNDPNLANNLVSNIKKEGTSYGSDAMLALARKREEEVLKNGRIKSVLDSTTKDSVNSADAAMAISAGTQIIMSYQDALAVAEQQQREGSITFQEYMDVVKSTSDATSEWANVIKLARENTDDSGATAQGSNRAMDLAGISEQQQSALQDSYKELWNQAGLTSTGGNSSGAKQVLTTSEGKNVNLKTESAYKSLEEKAVQAGYSADIQGVREYASETDLTPTERKARDAAIIDAGKLGELQSEVTTDDSLLFATRELAVSTQDAASAVATMEAIFKDTDALQEFVNTGGDMNAALAALNANIDLASQGVSESVQGMYTKTIGTLPDAQKADYSSYVSGATNKGGAIKAFNSVGAGMGPVGQLEMQTEFLNTGNILSGFASEETVNRLRSSDAYKGMLGKVKSEKVYRDGPKGSKIPESSADSSDIRELNKQMERAKEIGASETILNFSLRAVDQSKPGSNINLTDYFSEMLTTIETFDKNIPKDFQIAIGLDTQNAVQMSDLAGQEGNLISIYETIGLMSESEQQIAARISLSVVDGKNVVISPEDLVTQIEDVTKAIKNLDSKNINVEKEAILTIIQSFKNNDGELINAETAEKYYDEWISDKDIGQKKVSAVNQIDLQTLINLETSIEGKEETLSNLKASLGLAYGSGNMAAAAGIEEQIKIIEQELVGAEGAKQIIFDRAGNNAKNTGGGGGSDSPLKSFIKNIVDQAKMWSDASSTISKINNAKNLFVDMVLKGQSIFDKLKGTEGMTPEGLEQVLGMGPEGAKEFIKKYVKETNVTKKGKKVKNYTITKEGKNILNAQTLSGIGQTAASAYLEREASRDRKQAARGLNERGVSQEVMENISGDTNKSREFNELQKQVENSKGKNRKDAIKELNNYLKLQQDIVDQVKKEDKARDPIKHKIDEKIDKQKKAMDVANAYFDFEYAKIDEALQKEFESKNGMSAAQLEIDIKLREDAIDDIRKEIEVLNDAIRAIETRRSDSSKYSEWGLEQLQKEISANQTLIAQYERQNEMDQRRIQTLQRQDELRNRESEAISYELEAMSQVEEKIRESYDKRLEALDKIAKANDHLINQQKQQLGLSQAISEGDIYAATAAAQEMRASSAQFASEQARSGLQENMENSIEGLLTSGGLTREQAEERIRQIKEQSYQTSLLIREIEDAIYNRNLNNILPLKDKEYNLNLGLKDIQDQIALKQEQIRVIEETRIAPLEKINASHTEALNDLALQTEVAQAAVKYEGLRREQWNRMNNLVVAGLNWQRTFANDTIDARDNARSLANAWRDVSRQVDAARRAMTDKITILDNTAAEELNRKSADATYVNDDFDYEALLAAINAEHSEKIDGILNSAPALTLLNSGGNVSGNGSRDSVSARLTPGEFVIRKAMVDKYGMPMFNKINQGSFSMPKYQTSTSTAGNVKIKSENNTNIVSPMYNNYSVSVNVSGSNSTADEVANKVMFKMKQLQNQNIRGNRG